MKTKVVLIIVMIFTIAIVHVQWISPKVTSHNVPKSLQLPDLDQKRVEKEEFERKKELYKSGVLRNKALLYGATPEEFSKQYPEGFENMTFDDYKAYLERQKEIDKPERIKAALQTLEMYRHFTAGSGSMLDLQRAMGSFDNPTRGVGLQYDFAGSQHDDAISDPSDFNDLENLEDFWASLQQSKTKTKLINVLIVIGLSVLIGYLIKSSKS